MLAEAAPAKDIGEIGSITTVLYVFAGSCLSVIVAMAGLWWRETNTRLKGYEDRERKQSDTFQRHAEDLTKLTREVTAVVSQNNERLKQSIDEAREMREHAVEAKEQAEKARQASERTEEQTRRRRAE